MADNATIGALRVVLELDTVDHQAGRMSASLMSGAKADIVRGPRCADFVEKVF